MTNAHYIQFCRYFGKYLQKKTLYLFFQLFTCLRREKEYAKGPQASEELEDDSRTACAIFYPACFWQ